jgi:hypothetical protein
MFSGPVNEVTWKNDFRKRTRGPLAKIFDFRRPLGIGGDYDRLQKKKILVMNGLFAWGELSLHKKGQLKMMIKKKTNTCTIACHIGVTYIR